MKPKHQQARRRYRQTHRAPGLLTSARWKNLRLQVIAQEPLCQLRLSVCTVYSDTADHIIPVSTRPDLRFLRSNLRGACRACNMLRGNRPLSEVRREDELARPKTGPRAAPKKPAAALEFFDIEGGQKVTPPRETS